MSDIEEKKEDYTKLVTAKIEKKGLKKINIDDINLVWETILKGSFGDYRNLYLLFIEKNDEEKKTILFALKCLLQDDYLKINNNILRSKDINNPVNKITVSFKNKKNEYFIDDVNHYVTIGSSILHSKCTLNIESFSRCHIIICVSENNNVYLIDMGSIKGFFVEKNDIIDNKKICYDCITCINKNIIYSYKERVRIEKLENDQEFLYIGKEQITTQKFIDYDIIKIEISRFNI